MSLKRFALACMLCVIVAATALYAAFDAGFYAPERAGSLRQMLPHTAASAASYEIGAYPLYPTNLAAGDGQSEVASYCNACHSPRYITMQPPLPPETWAAEVNKMVNVMGQPIPDEVQPVIIKYLQTHYTPETRKP